MRRWTERTWCPTCEAEVRVTLSADGPPPLVVSVEAVEADCACGEADPRTYADRIRDLVV